MAFAVTAFKSYGKPIDQALVKRFEHTIEMNISNLAADVDADIGDLAGQFFTDAEADATYGATASALKAILADIAVKATHGDYFSEVLSTGFVRVAGAPAGATEYQVAAYTGHVPEIAFFAASAPTSWKLTLNFRLKTGEWPSKDVAYGVGI